MNDVVIHTPHASAAVANPPADANVPGEACPLCGTLLRPEQEWCLRCGAAARTRLASTPNWRRPLAVLGLAAALALGALTASLVTLAGGAKTTPATTITHTVTTPAGGATTTPGATVPGATAPGTGTPDATTAPGATSATTTTTAQSSKR